MELEYGFEELDNGQTVITCSDGRYFDAGMIDMLFELHKQNPEFFDHWMGLAQNYVLFGNSVAEA